MAICSWAPKNKGDKVSAHTLYISGQLGRFPLLGGVPLKNKTLLCSLHYGVAVLGKFGGNPLAKNWDEGCARLLIYREM